jgi:hypothetical protein
VIEPTPLAATSQNDLQKQVGFAVLMPTYLPVGCALQKYQYVSLARELALVYACEIGMLMIAERKAETVQRPFVGPSSTQGLVINGQPAMYIVGGWVTGGPNNETGTKWMDGGVHQVVFEKNNILIRMNATILLNKEELIKIAESMQ